MAIRLIAVDLDGTLYTTQCTITETIKKAAAKAAAAGIEVVVCSGRSISEFQDVLEALPQIRYAVSCTGAVTLNVRTGETISSHLISAEDARMLYERLQQADEMITLFEDGKTLNDRAHMEHFDRYYDPVIRPLFEKYHVMIDSLENHLRQRTEPIDKLYMSFPNEEEAQKARRAVAGLDFFVTGAGYCDLEIMSAETDKSIGLSELAAYLGIQRAEIMAIGDSENDKAVLEYAGTAVAMENGEDAIKAIADLIAPSNDENGVAWAIEQVLEGKV